MISHLVKDIMRLCHNTACFSLRGVLLLGVIQRHHPKLSIILLLLLMSLVNLPQAYRIGKFHFVNKVGKLTLQVMNLRFLRSARVLPEDPKGVKVKVHTPVGEEIQQECFLPGDVNIKN